MSHSLEDNCLWRSTFRMILTSSQRKLHSMIGNCPLRSPSLFRPHITLNLKFGISMISTTFFKRIILNLMFGIRHHLRTAPYNYTTRYYSGIFQRFYYILQVHSKWWRELNVWLGGTLCIFTCF